MVMTTSNMLPLGTKALDFTLLDIITENKKSLSELKSDQATVIMFICNHCPFVIHVQQELVRLANDYLPKEVAFIAISSNDVKNYPDDAPEKMQEVAKQMSYPFPYLYDETQQVAKDYDAACTPDFYVFNKEMKLVYRGQLDDSRPGNQIPVTGKDIRAALDNLLAGKLVNSEQKPSIGCNIKWK
jgi:peroxiredoxin